MIKGGNMNKNDIAYKDNRDLSEAEREEIKNFAKELFFESDADGKQVNGLRDIAEKIREVFHVNYSHITIHNWAKDGNWKQIFDVGVKLGEKKAVDAIKKKYDVDLEQHQTEIVDDEVYKRKIAQIKRAVIMQQAQVVKKMKLYVDSLPDASSKIPNAGRAFSDANKTLFDMIEKSPLGENQRVSLNIQVVNPDKMTVDGENV